MQKKKDVGGKEREERRGGRERGGTDGGRLCLCVWERSEEGDTTYFELSTRSTSIIFFQGNKKRR